MRGVSTTRAHAHARTLFAEHRPRYAATLQRPGTPPCPCEGRYNPAAPGEHYVWLALLHRDNDEAGYRARDADASAWTAFVNASTCFLDWTTIIHCQLVFWCRSAASFYTFSVDATHNRVFFASRKRFSRGWAFVRMRVSAAEERAAYEFLRTTARARTHFNRLGAYLVPLRPLGSSRGFFCSQLVVAALQAAELLPGVQPHAVSPAGVERLLRALYAARLYDETEHLICPM